MIIDLNHRIGETQEEIQSLKFSTQLTIGQIKHDHMEVLERERMKAVANTEERAHILQERLDKEISSRRKQEDDHKNEIGSMMESLDERVKENEVLTQKNQKVSR